MERLSEKMHYHYTKTMLILQFLKIPRYREEYNVTIFLCGQTD
jgi:hypothetical protein